MHALRRLKIEEKAGKGKEGGGFRGILSHVRKRIKM
jgi:hypothetical protein